MLYRHLKEMCHSNQQPGRAEPWICVSVALETRFNGREKKLGLCLRNGMEFELVMLFNSNVSHQRWGFES